MIVGHKPSLSKANRSASGGSTRPGKSPEDITNEAVLVLAHGLEFSITSSQYTLTDAYSKQVVFLVFNCYKVDSILE